MIIKYSFDIALIININDPKLFCQIPLPQQRQSTLRSLFVDLGHCSWHLQTRGILFHSDKPICSLNIFSRTGLWSASFAAQFAGTWWKFWVRSCHPTPSRAIIPHCILCNYRPTLVARLSKKWSAAMQAIYMMLFQNWQSNLIPIHFGTLPPISLLKVMVVSAFGWWSILVAPAFRQTWVRGKAFQRMPNFGTHGTNSFPPLCFTSCSP